MITLEDAQQKILGEIVTFPSEIVSIWDAEGRVSSEDVVSRVDLPVFDNSAMDGYALRVSDQGVYGERACNKKAVQAPRGNMADA